jgi:hypothetical protein
MIAAGGCAIMGTDDEPRAISNNEIPEELFTTSTTPTTVAVEPDYELPLFFVFQDRLAMTTRPFETEPSVQHAVDALVAGTTDQEAAAGLETKLFPGMSLLSMADGLLTVHVDGEEARAATGENPNRVALVYSQIVCTVNALVPEGEPEILVTIVDDNDEPTIKVSVTDAVLAEPVGPGHFGGCQTEPLPENEETDEDDDEDGDGGSTSTTIAIPGVSNGTS